eukprot:TRINITY_DN80466_c0_g1_i1.p1 TRINITY_DN80466_c0_g1~~TRINITY_DN80466_c0_g1_i1.p1  ORF type:complete len:203 (+),score=24.26 TRINITY_DN80466_c0_g1_i1:75-683(+)
MAQEALELGGEALEGLAELPRGLRRLPLPLTLLQPLAPLPGASAVASLGEDGGRLRAASASWGESFSADGQSEPDNFTEYTLDSQDTSVSSTRASTSATQGSNSRLSRTSTRGFSVVVRGGRSPQALLRGFSTAGYRGRSVTRNERQNPGAAMRHRHPTHTPSRGPNSRRFPDAAALMQAAAEGTRLLQHQIGRVHEEWNAL